MIRRNAWILILSALIVPLVLSCNNSPNPFSASDASISLRLVNSSDQRGDHSISDTVGKTVRVGVSGYLIQYITSVSVLVGKSPTDTDTSFTFGSFSSSTDTLWLDIAFKSAGSRKVTAVASIQGASPYTDTATIVVIALPVPTYAVSYDGNGNTSGSVPVDANSYQQGAGVTVKANTGSLVKTGFTFAGWNTAADGSGTSYAGGESFLMTAGNVTLFAKWTQNPTYGVTYSGNNNTSGTVPADANAYLQGATVTVLANSGSLARTGYTFAGWNTAADGSGTSYAGGETFAIASANVTLYAVWTQNPTYTVTYSGNNNSSGTAPTDANAYQQGANVTAKANTGNLARTGYTFAGWNTAADGSGTSYAAGTAFNIGTANVTLYAVWTQNPTYAVTYSGNNNTSGAAPTDANAYQQGAIVTVKTNSGNLARTGYTFASWNTAADGSGTTYATGANLAMPGANITLYAVWTQNVTYTVTYNANGGDASLVPVDANAYQQGATVTVKAAGSLTRTGYSFAGWNTAADGTGTSYNAAATFLMGAANVTLFAKWSLIPTYTVTYNANGGDVTMIPVDANTYAQGATVTVKAPGGLTRTGYNFNGWNTAADGTGTSYATAATFPMGNANVVLYAKWTIKQDTVTFSSSGGSTVASQIIAYGGTATAPGAPTQSGFLFAGWYSDQALTIQYNFSTAITASIILYAKWTPVYTVTYNSNSSTSGTVPVDTNKYTNGVTVSVLDNTGNLARTGYTFAGWNTNAAGTGTDRVPGNTFAMGSLNVILYAKWTINQYSVIFNSNGGSTVASQSVNYGSTATVPNAPTKTSYVFAGWYSDVGLTTAYNFATAVTAATTLYAKWQIQDADGNIYTEVTIGTQVWMVENLKTTKYNDGGDIPNVVDNIGWGTLQSPAYCWYNNDSTFKNPYGALYTWYAVNTTKLAPTGWHVPTLNEWSTLFSYLGADDAGAGKLKEAGFTHWNSPNSYATNSTEFTGLPGGLRYDGAGTFGGNMGQWGMWWLTDENSSSDGWYFGLGYNTPYDIYHANKASGMSIRCIRNQ